MTKSNVFKKLSFLLLVICFLATTVVAETTQETPVSTLQESEHEVFNFNCDAKIQLNHPKGALHVLRHIGLLCPQFHGIKLKPENMANFVGAILDAKGNFIDDLARLSGAEPIYLSPFAKAGKVVIDRAERLFNDWDEAVRIKDGGGMWNVLRTSSDEDLKEKSKPIYVSSIGPAGKEILQSVISTKSPSFWKITRVVGSNIVMLYMFLVFPLVGLAYYTRGRVLDYIPFIDLQSASSMFGLEVANGSGESDVMVTLVPVRPVVLMQKQKTTFGFEWIPKAAYSLNLFHFVIKDKKIN